MSIQEYAIPRLSGLMQFPVVPQRKTTHSQFPDWECYVNLVKGSISKILQKALVSEFLEPPIPSPT